MLTMLNKDKAWITHRCSFLGWSLLYLIFWLFCFLFYYWNIATTSKVSFCFKTSCWLLILKDVDAFCKILWSCLPWLWKYGLRFPQRTFHFKENRNSSLFVAMSCSEIMVWSCIVCKTVSLCKSFVEKKLVMALQ